MVLSKKISRATFFVFWGTQLVDIYLNNLPLKQIWRKSAVWHSHVLLGRPCFSCPITIFNVIWLIPWLIIFMTPHGIASYMFDHELLNTFKFIWVNWKTAISENFLCFYLFLIRWKTGKVSWKISCYSAKVLSFQFQAQLSCLVLKLKNIKVI